ncbi:Transcription factor WhiB [Actinomyces bovis]|uniref:Transcriptional regulator WhiB n=1 Tax=Actinomyces bovis TaxID=1658 RepID=A0ABY1VL96_9ACTO|nr:WhiB family transcriptional regulator [Actinomyces bovis]SPT52856.1 Transcription factor WhiB [Actinomyces bovis]VEG54952.1 Transcription factor WhiB [Actinomyces israelii]
MLAIAQLPGPVAELWEWQVRGACRSADASMFFHPEGERGSARRNRDIQAKQLCANCPVIEQCREHALRVNEPYGVWGGMSEEDRRAALADQSANRYSARPAVAESAA